MCVIWGILLGLIIIILIIILLWMLFCMADDCIFDWLLSVKLQEKVEKWLEDKENNNEKL